MNDEELTHAQRRVIESNLRRAEQLQREQMAESNWDAVWKLQDAITTLSAMLGREPYVQ